MYRGNSNNSWAPLSLGFHDIERYLEDLDTQDQEPQSQQPLSVGVQPQFPDLHSDLEQRPQPTPSVDRPPQSSQLQSHAGPRPQPTPSVDRPPQSSQLQSHAGPRPQQQVPEVPRPLAQPLQPEDKDNSSTFDSEQTNELNTNEVLEMALDLAETFPNHKKDLSFPIYYDCPFLPKVNKVTKQIVKADKFIDHLVKVRMDFDTECEKLSLPANNEFKKATTYMRRANRSKGSLSDSLPKGTDSKLVLRKESEKTGSPNSSFVDVETLDNSDEVMLKEKLPKVDNAGVAMSAAYATDVRMSASGNCQVDLSKMDLSKAGMSEIKDKLDLQSTENDALEMALEIITVELDQQKQLEGLTKNATVVTAELDTEQRQLLRTHITFEHENKYRSYNSKASVVTVELEDQQEHCLIKKSPTPVELEHHKLQSHASSAMAASAELAQRQSQGCKRAAVRDDVKHNQRCQNANDRSTTNENEYHQLKRHRSEPKTATSELDPQQQQCQTLDPMAATTEPEHHWPLFNVSEATPVTAKLEKRSYKRRKAKESTADLEHHQQEGQSSKITSAIAEWEQQRNAAKAKSATAKMENQKQYRSNATVVASKLEHHQQQHCSPTLDHYQQQCNTTPKANFASAESENYQRQCRTPKETASAEFKYPEQQLYASTSATNQFQLHQQQFFSSNAAVFSSELQQYEQQRRTPKKTIASAEYINMETAAPNNAPQKLQQKHSALKATTPSSTLANLLQQSYIPNEASATCKLQLDQQQWTSTQRATANFEVGQRSHTPNRLTPNAQMELYQQQSHTSKEITSTAEVEQHQQQRRTPKETISPGELQFYRNTATTGQLDHHQQTNFTPIIKKATSQLANLLQHRPALQSTANTDQLHRYQQQNSIPSSPTSGLQPRHTPTPTSSTNMQLNQQQRQKPNASTATVQLAQYLHQRQISKETSLPTGPTHQQTQNTLKRTAADAALDYHQHQRHNTNAATATSTQMEFNQQAQPYASRRTSASVEFGEIQRQIQTPQPAFVTSNQHSMLVNYDSEPNNCSNYNPQLSMDQNKATKRVFAPVQFTAQPQQHCLNPYQSNLNLQTSLCRPSTNPMDLPANSQPSFESHQRFDQAMHQFHGNQITDGRPQRTHNDQMNNLPQVNSGERLMIKYNHRTPESSQSSWNTSNTSGAAPERLRILSNAERIQPQLAHRNYSSPMSASNPFDPQYSYQSIQNFNVSAPEFRQPFPPQTPRGAQRQTKDEIRYKLQSQR
ncbi:hypothetical protein Bpfe_007365 [Biomphalaria pfeifferi]|uniref:Uncharacterized protein n=1 Tax=Biomphalaria pfeifferi TaxID=112525 RepID=A0AAD8FHB7_BIOPF|nr:hypothetical protein Bpfe_007365 [Biomphalaria pfeifferi]